MSRNKVLLYSSGITFGIGYFISWLLLFRNKGFIGFLICNITFAICITLLLFMKPQRKSELDIKLEKIEMFKKWIEEYKKEKEKDNER